MEIIKYREYKTSEACKILGLNRSTLQFYYDQGIIIPVKDATGRGSQRYFSPKNLVELSYSRHFGEKIVRVKELPETARHIEKLVTFRNGMETGAIGKNVDFLDPCSFSPPESVLYMGIRMVSADQKLRGLTEVLEGMTIFVLPQDKEKVNLSFDYHASLYFLNLTVVKNFVIQRIKKFHG